MQPLASFLQDSDLQCQIYADDTQLLVDLHPDASQNVQIPFILSHIQRWMHSNWLKLNSTKTEIMLFHGNSKSPPPVLSWPDSWGPPPTPAVFSRDLGIFLDPKLDGSAHANSVIKSAHHKMNSLQSVLPLLNIPQKTQVLQSLVCSRLHYGAHIFLGTPLKYTQGLQRAQNRAIRLIYNLPRRTHISPYRNGLHWLTIVHLIQLKACVWLWQIFHGKGPRYMARWATPRPMLTSTRKAYTFSFTCPAIKKTTRGGRRLAIAGAKIWNQLPLELRSLTSLNQFKMALKTHLLRIQENSVLTRPVVNKFSPTEKTRQPLIYTAPRPSAVMPRPKPAMTSTTSDHANMTSRACDFHLSIPKKPVLSERPRRPVTTSTRHNWQAKLIHAMRVRCLPYLRNNSYGIT